MKVKDLIAELKKMDGNLDIDFRIRKQVGDDDTENAVMEMNIDYPQGTLVMTSRVVCEK